MKGRGNASLPDRPAGLPGVIRCNALSPPGGLSSSGLLSQLNRPARLARLSAGSRLDNPLVALSSDYPRDSASIAGDGLLRKSFIERNPPCNQSSHERRKAAPHGVTDSSEDFNAARLAVTPRGEAVEGRHFEQRRLEAV